MDASSEKFEAFWKAYPRRVAKGAARLKWKSRKCDVIFPQIMEALERQKASAQWRDLQFVPHPSTWLNQERWDDEVYDVPFIPDTALPPWMNCNVPQTERAFLLKDYLHLIHETEWWVKHPYYATWFKATRAAAV